MNNLFKTISYFSLLFLVLLHPLHAQFAEVDGSKKLAFPEAHGSHPTYQIEWWYFVGHLQTLEKKTFGYELTFFRVGNDSQIKNSSNWNLDSFYLAHFAVTDDQNKKFHHGEKTTRSNFEQAGSKENVLEVWVKDWKVFMKEEDLFLKASLENISLDLKLTPSKAVVLHGKNGFSKKGPKHGEASYYSSFTRLNGKGTLRIDNQEHQIEQVTAWMDHEVTSKDLPEGIVGWDWFAIQLEDNKEIMVYQLRQENGEKSPFSKGSYISSDGHLETFNADEFSIQALSKWKSSKTEIEYPSTWNIKIPKYNYDLKIIPTIPNQELTTENSTNITYWEGRCLVENTTPDRKISGVAYVELTGYGKKLDYF